MGFADRVNQAVHIAMPDALVRSEARPDCLNVYVSWPQAGDPNRPAKMSKTICITISSETLDDLNNELPHRQRDAEENVVEFLAFKLHNFGLANHAPAGQRAPEEQWTILYRDLLDERPNTG